MQNFEVWFRWKIIENEYFIYLINLFYFLIEKVSDHVHDHDYNICLVHLFFHRDFNSGVISVPYWTIIEPNNLGNGDDLFCNRIFNIDTDQLRTRFSSDLYLIITTYCGLVLFDPHFCMLVETTMDYYMDRNVWDTASITINFDIELDKLTPYS